MIGRVKRTQPPAEHSCAESMAVILETCLAAAEGDLEARVPLLPGTSEQVGQLRRAVNLLLDRTDAYVRESGASLQAAAEGRFYRRFLLDGTQGVFRAGAQTINSATAAMAETRAELDAEAQRRAELADRLEQRVGLVAVEMAESATRLSGAAASLGDSAHRAGTETNAAETTMQQVAGAAQEINEVVQLISAIAAQTRLLALNATIEAARAGEAGRGFAVVASEVKQLADSTAQATTRITAQVAAMGEVTQASSEAMSAVDTTVQEMVPMVDAVRTAVDGHPGGSDVYPGDLAGNHLDANTAAPTGLAALATSLRTSVGEILANLRARG